MKHNIQEGDLLAYLDGETNPEITNILQASPELQTELNALRQVDTHLRQELGNAGLQNRPSVIDKKEIEALLVEYEQLINLRKEP